MRRFLRHLAAFSIPPALALLAGEGVLQGSGEAWPIDRVIAFQREHPRSLFLRAVDQLFYASKYRGVLAHAPSVLVVGSSRTMKFRAGMFGDRAAAFFNAGGMVNSLDDLEDFTVSFPPPRTPDVLIVGVDLWWLNERVPPSYRFAREIARGGTWTFDEHIVALRWLLQRPRTLASELTSLVARAKPEEIGINARQNGGGFRADGSFKAVVPTPRSDAEWTFVDRESPPIIERVTTATANFLPTDRVSPARLAQLSAILDEYEKRHVLVIAYLPPFSSAVARQLETDSRHATFFAEFRRIVPHLFAGHGFPVVDVSYTDEVSMDDRAMSDGFHGEETLHARAVLRMLRNDRVAAALPGAGAAIDRALASPRTNYWAVDLP